MKVIIDLSEETLKRLGIKADFKDRSRKKYMEMVLTSDSMKAPYKLKYKIPVIKKSN